MSVSRTNLTALNIKILRILKKAASRCEILNVFIILQRNLKHRKYETSYHYNHHPDDTADIRKGDNNQLYKQLDAALAQRAHYIELKRKA